MPKTKYEWAIYQIFDPDKYDNDWLRPTDKQVATCVDAETANIFAAQKPCDGKSKYKVIDSCPWKRGDMMSADMAPPKERTIAIPFELFRKIVVYFVFYYHDGKIEKELHDELEEMIKNIDPKERE